MKKKSTILITSIIVLAFIIIASITFLGVFTNSRFDSNKYYSKHRNIKLESRHLNVTEYDTIIGNYKIGLMIEMRDSVKIYRYNNLKDSTKNIEFRFLNYKDIMMVGPSELSLIKRDVKFNNISFDKYQQLADDGVGPVFFNIEYGVLIFENGWGKRFYFSDNELFQKTDSIVQDNTD